MPIPDIRGYDRDCGITSSSGQLAHDGRKSQGRRSHARRKPSIQAKSQTLTLALAYVRRTRVPTS